MIQIMTYNKVEIGIPTVEQIQECANKCGYKFNAYDCFAYFKAKDWKTEKGRDYWSLEFACTVYNGVAIYKQQKKVDESNFNTLSYEGSPYKEQLLDKRWQVLSVQELPLIGWDMIMSAARLIKISLTRQKKDSNKKLHN